MKRLAKTAAAILAAIAAIIAGFAGVAHADADAGGANVFHCGTVGIDHVFDNTCSAGNLILLDQSSENCGECFSEEVLETQYTTEFANNALDEAGVFNFEGTGYFQADSNRDAAPFVFHRDNEAFCTYWLAGEYDGTTSTCSCPAVAGPHPMHGRCMASSTACIEADFSQPIADGASCRAATGDEECAAAFPGLRGKEESGTCLPASHVQCFIFDENQRFFDDMDDDNCRAPASPEECTEARPGYEFLSDGSCVAPCGANQTRDMDGVCQIDTGDTWECLSGTSMGMDPHMQTTSCANGGNYLTDPNNGTCGGCISACLAAFGRIPYVVNEVGFCGPVDACAFAGGVAADGPCCPVGQEADVVTEVCAPACARGMERVNGTCEPICETDSETTNTRDASGTCCPAGQEADVVTEVCAPACGMGMERANGTCESICAAPNIRDASGACCPVGQEADVVTEVCAPACGMGMERVNGTCDPICELPDIRNESGTCLGEGSDAHCAFVSPSRPHYIADDGECGNMHQPCWEANWRMPIWDVGDSACRAAERGDEDSCRLITIPGTSDSFERVLGGACGLAEPTDEEACSESEMGVLTPDLFPAPPAGDDLGAIVGGCVSCEAVGRRYDSDSESCVPAENSEQCRMIDGLRPIYDETAGACEAAQSHRECIDEHSNFPIMTADGSCRAAVSDAECGSAHAETQEFRGTCQVPVICRVGDQELRDDNTCACPEGEEEFDRGTPSDPSDDFCDMPASCRDDQIQIDGMICTCRMGEQEVGGTCQMPASCRVGDQELRDDNTCACPEGEEEFDNNTPSDPEDDFCEMSAGCRTDQIQQAGMICACPMGEQEANGFCVPETCRSDEERQSDRTCACPSGEEEFDNETPSDLTDDFCEAPACRSDQVQRPGMICECPAGEQEFEGECDVPVQCLNGTRTPANMCDCPPDRHLLNGECVESGTCPLGQSEFTISGRATCQEPVSCTGGTVSDANECSCAEPLMHFNGACAAPVACDGGTVSADNECVCDTAGYRAFNGVCAEPVACDGGTVSADNECVCDTAGYEAFNGVCAEPVACDGGTASADNECVCDTAGYEAFNGVCEEPVACARGTVGPDNTCECPPGQEPESGRCVALTTLADCSISQKLEGGRCVEQAASDCGVVEKFEGARCQPLAAADCAAGECLSSLSPAATYSSTDCEDAGWEWELDQAGDNSAGMAELCHIPSMLLLPEGGATAQQASLSAFNPAADACVLRQTPEYGEIHPMCDDATLFGDAGLPDGTALPVLVARETAIVTVTITVGGVESARTSVSVSFSVAGRLGVVQEGGAANRIYSSSVTSIADASDASPLPRFGEETVSPASAQSVASRDVGDKYVAPAAIVGMFVFLAAGMNTDLILKPIFSFSGENEAVDWDANVRADGRHEHFSQYWDASYSDEGELMIKSGAEYEGDVLDLSYSAEESKDLWAYDVQLQSPFSLGLWEVYPSVASNFRYRTESGVWSSASSLDLTAAWSAHKWGIKTSSNFFFGASSAGRGAIRIEAEKRF